MLNEFSYLSLEIGDPQGWVGCSVLLSVTTLLTFLYVLAFSFRLGHKPDHNVAATAPGITSSLGSIQSKKRERWKREDALPLPQKSPYVSSGRTRSHGHLWQDRLQKGMFSFFSPSSRRWSRKKEARNSCWLGMQQCWL